MSRWSARLGRGTQLWTRRTSRKDSSNMTEKEAIKIKVLKAMSHPARLRILRVLRAGALCAGKTNEEVHLSQPNLSQHLKVLRESGLLSTAKIGTRSCHYIARPSLVDAILDALDSKHDEIVKTTEQVCAEAKGREEGS